MKTHILPILMIVLFCTYSLGEQLSPARTDETAEEIISLVSAQSDRIRDISGELRSTIRLGDRRTEVISKFYFKRPNKIRRDAMEPQVQTVVSDGRAAWVYQPTMKRALRIDISRASREELRQLGLEGESGEDIISLIGSSFSLEIAGIEDVDGARAYRLEAKPKGPSRLPIQKIVLWIDSERWTVLKNKTFDSNGNLYISIEFGDYRDVDGVLFSHYQKITNYSPYGNLIREDFYSDVKINRGIEDSTFEFQVPNGVDVIIPTGGKRGESTQ
ncbi:MAG: LolA family protein [bacterium]